MLDKEKMISGKTLGMIMGCGPWEFALRRSSSPRIYSRLVFLRASPPSWVAQARLFSNISIPACHSLCQKDARCLLAVCLYLRNLVTSMSQHYSAIFRFPTSLFRIKLQREIHNLPEDYQPVLCSLWDVGAKHPTLKTRSTGLLERHAK